MVIITNMRNVILIIILIVISISAPYREDASVYFTPSKDCENVLVNLIDNVSERIDVAMYAINNDAIIDALKRAHNRGIKIRILTDRLQASGKKSKVIELYDYGINIRVNSKNKIEHNKFAIFDSLGIFTGSYNWTNPASTKNSENCLFLNKKNEITASYKKQFEHLWRINTGKKSRRWFKKRINKN